MITGKDKGKRGKVQQVLSDGKLIVAGINVVKKHQNRIRTCNNQAASLKKKLVSKLLTLPFGMLRLAKPTALAFKVEGESKVRILNPLAIKSTLDKAR